MTAPDTKKVFFWSEDLRPQDYVKNDIPTHDATDLIGIIREGEEVAAYRGMAFCRFENCHKELGSRDMAGHGFVWPERCEHYITLHNVWPPGADELLKAGREALKKKLEGK